MLIESLLVGTLLFFLYFIYDALYAKWSKYVNEKKAVKAANCSVAIYIIGTYGILMFITNHWMIIPICLGAWLGTFWATRLGD